MNDENETTSFVDETESLAAKEEETTSDTEQVIIVYAETETPIDYTEYIETNINILSSIQTSLYVIMTCVMLAWVHLITRRRSKK